MNDVINTFLLVYAALFPLVNPFGSAPFFLGLTEQYTNEERARMSRQIAINSFLLLLASALFVVVIVGLLLLQNRVLRGRSFVTVSGKDYRLRTMRLGRAKYLVFAAVLLFNLVSIGLPTVFLLVGSFQRSLKVRAATGGKSRVRVHLPNSSGSPLSRPPRTKGRCATRPSFAPRRKRMS